MAGAMKFEVPLFDGRSNFTVWQCTIKDILVQQGLDVALDPEIPEEMKESEWKSIERKAASTIRLALTPAIKFMVLNETSPKEIWRKLEEIYASKSLTNRLCLKMDLYNLKMEEGGNIHDHINAFNQLVCQLLNVGEKLSDEEQAIILLASLPQSYRSLVRSLLIGKDTIKLDDVTKVLREDQIMHREHTNESGGVLAVESSQRRSNNYRFREGQRGKPQVRDYSDLRCHYCEEDGHIQTHCPMFREDLKRLKQLKGNERSNINVVETANDGDIFLIESNDLVESNSKWVLDSAADMHVCKDQTMFTTLHKNGDFGYINVGKKHKLHVEGIGKVRLKLHNGKVHDIPNVRYVPTANVNIISLGEMTSHGYKYVGIGNTCKVYKGNRLILQGRKGEKNICYLEGHSMRGILEDSKVKKTIRILDRIEGSEDLAQGRICYVIEPSPTSLKL